MAAIAGLNGDVWLSANPSILLGAPESATDSGDHITYTMSVHKYLDKRATLLIEQSANGSTGWTTVPASQYTMRFCGGIIVFTPARVVATNNFIRVTANYFNVSQLTDINDWSLDIGADTEDSTPFQSPWRTNALVSKKASGKCNGFKSDDFLSKDLGNLMVLVLYANKALNQRWECYAILNQVVPKLTATSLMKEETSFTIDGDVFYYAS